LPAAARYLADPIVILFVLAYRKITSGNFIGAVKG